MLDGGPLLREADRMIAIHDVLQNLFVLVDIL